MSSKLFIKYGNDFSFTAKTRFVVLHGDSATSFIRRIRQNTADFFV
jgi:hypothetical protein